MQDDINHNSSGQGQAMIEFTFCMVIATFILLGMIEIFNWSGRSLVENRQAHEAVLSSNIDDNHLARPLGQVRPIYYHGTDMVGVPIASNIYGNN